MQRIGIDNNSSNDNTRPVILFYFIYFIIQVELEVQKRKYNNYTKINTQNYK